MWRGLGASRSSVRKASSIWPMWNAVDAPTTGTCTGLATTSDEESAGRVLIVGPRFSIKPSCALWPGGRNGLMFHSFGLRLANGFCNGHFAFALDDRECAPGSALVSQHS
jgi:hypothetical protein